MQVNLKALKPVGIVIVLGAAILALILCFTADMGVPPKYESAHDAEYYLQSEETMNELAEELRENVFPRLDGVTECSYDAATGKLAVFIENEQFGKVKQVLLRDFDERLFEFCRSK